MVKSFWPSHTQYPCRSLDPFSSRQCRSLCFKWACSTRPLFLRARSRWCMYRELGMPSEKSCTLGASSKTKSSTGCKISSALSMLLSQVVLPSTVLVGNSRPCSDMCSLFTAGNVVGMALRNAWKLAMSDKGGLTTCGWMLGNGAKSHRSCTDVMRDNR